MVHIQEIPIEKVNEFWELHMQYLVDDEIISGEEDIEYFSGNEYRDTIVAHMKREENKHHMVYFVRDSIAIGAAQYITEYCNPQLSISNTKYCGYILIS